MKKFLDENFVLETKTAEHLYHQYAESMPIIDYHSHLPPEDLASDRNFENLTQIWLYGDHYKWRAMRTNGVDEKYVTGDASDKEKFMKWAKTVPYTMRNPLYHWTHLELQRTFNIDTLLNEDSAEKIYEEASEKLRSSEFSVKNILKKMRVEIVCTTDDPIDDLQYHKDLKQQGEDVKVLPTFRPDKAMMFLDLLQYNQYLDNLGAVCNIKINSYSDLINALKSRHDYFQENGCRLSDHGLEKVPFKHASKQKVESIFNDLRSNKEVSADELEMFQTAVFVELGKMDAEKDWVQQLHIGAIRNNNKALFNSLGADIGCDSIHDLTYARELSSFLSELAESDSLPKTILYNLNPRDNEMLATMIGNFQDGKTVGKMQFGSGWWFLDQKQGMENQMNALSNLGLLSHFVGMLTDSRSFLSYPRHEYFRRILCNLYGNDIENGLLPNDTQWIGKCIQNICYYNSLNYFKF